MLKFATTIAAGILCSTTALLAQSSHTVTVTEVIVIRQTVITPNKAPTYHAAAPASHATTGTGTWGNGYNIRYVKGTSREAGRQKFHWQE